MNDTKSYGRGTVVFREGDPADCMYEIQSGCVGIYRDYGGANEKLITKLYGVSVLGEMGLVDHSPRSATAVVLEGNTMLTKVTEDDFFSYFEGNPVAVLDIMSQMCNRLRKTTKDYSEACHTVYDVVETKKSGQAKSKSLLDRIKSLLDTYAAM